MRWRPRRRRDGAIQRRWEDPALKPMQERDATQKAYKRYLEQRDFGDSRDLVGALRARLWRRRWQKSQTEPHGRLGPDEHESE